MQQMSRQKTYRRKIFAVMAFLAMTLGFMSSITPLWAAQNDDGSTLVICSSFGTRTITLDANGKEIPALPTYKKCSMCLVHAVDFQAPDLFDITSIAPSLIDDNTCKIFHNAGFAHKDFYIKTRPRAPPAYS